MYKKTHFYFFSGLLLLVSACSIDPPAPIPFAQNQTPVSFLKEVKPILDQRCVACHSCYNAACQAKFSSYEGIDRGATKIKVYDATRLSPIEPTRLFQDANTTDEWRKKGFYSLTQNNENTSWQNNDILSHLLNHKMKNPEVAGSYDPEHESLICPKDNEELGEYFDEKPNHGMPYGFPALEEKQYLTLMQWLSQGAEGPKAEEQKTLSTPSKIAQKEINKWDSFFNQPSPKHSVSARYLYEHLYLAHLNFKASPNEFYSLVRSRTPAPEAIDEIVTVRPFDDPKTARVYYRFKKIHSTIVHKTHMVVELDNKKLSRLSAQFIESEWDETPHFIPYSAKASANPFIVFSQIPTRTRYQFLLDNSHYMIMTFIHGPVCRGQMALNVIHDHFWVMFQDPDYDISVQQPHFLLRQTNNLVTPIESNNYSLLKTFTNDYLKKYDTYIKAKAELYGSVYPDGLSYDAIWKGEKASDAPMLTIYRHFNSASVHKGILGGMPRTLWVVDFPQFERIYYSLVAGYDVFGNVSHQTNIRRYMDFLRIEGEANFLSYMPKDKRLPMFKSWYKGDSSVQKLSDKLAKNFRPSGMDFKTEHPKAEFVESLVKKHLLPSTNIVFDEINYFSPNEKPPKMPAELTNLEAIKDAFRSLTIPKIGFLNYATDFGVNVIHLRITGADGKDHVGTMVVNRWHDNVYSMFTEASTLNPDKDTIDFLPGSVGSYPNIFVEIKFHELPDFLDLIKNYDDSDTYKAKAKHYFISRSNPEFWKTYDWFQAHFNESDPIRAGLYDLNRYYREAW